MYCKWTLKEMMKVAAKYYEIMSVAYWCWSEQVYEETSTFDGYDPNDIRTVKIIVTRKKIDDDDPDEVVHTVTECTLDSKNLLMEDLSCALYKIAEPIKTELKSKMKEVEESSI